MMTKAKRAVIELVHSKTVVHVNMQVTMTAMLC